MFAGVGLVDIIVLYYDSKLHSGFASPTVIVSPLISQGLTSKDMKVKVIVQNSSNHSLVIQAQQELFTGRRMQMEYQTQN